jgi:hypothetical protein
MNLMDRFKLMTAMPSGRNTTMVWFAKFGVLCVIFLIFFIPEYGKAGIMSSNMRSLQEQISNLKNISVNLLSPEELRQTQDHVEDFKSRLLDSSQASALLDFIAEEADKEHINVIQIYSDSPVGVKSDAGRELEFEGKKIMFLPVNFRVETDYKSFGNFLKSLKDNTKGNFLLESMTLKRSDPESEKLQCDVTLSFVVK